MLTGRLGVFTIATSTSTVSDEDKPMSTASPGIRASLAGALLK